MGIFERFKHKQEKEEEQTMEKSNSKRKHRIKIGLPQELLSKLVELYEFLTIRDAMDMRSYIETDYDELMKVSGLNTSYLAAIIREKLVLKESTGEGHNFKYRWDSIYPTLDMAVKIIEKEYDKKFHSNVETISIAESEREKAEGTQDKQRGDEFTSLIDYRTEDDIMTIRLNLNHFNVKESDVINNVMLLLVGRKTDDEKS